METSLPSIMEDNPYYLQGSIERAGAEWHMYWLLFVYFISEGEIELESNDGYSYGSAEVS